MTFTIRPRPSVRVRLAAQLPLAATLGAVAVWATGVQPVLLVFLYLAAVTGELCRVDVAEHRLPNAILLPGYALAAVALVWLAMLAAEAVVVPLAAGAGFLSFLLVMNLAGGVGMGDVKLAGLLGIGLGSLGLTAAVAGPVLAFVTGGIGGLVALLVPGGSTLHRIPFGPYLLLGFWATVVFARLSA
ncbi:MAG: prepilin peptidase [Microbacteriaceae bacterium]